MAASMTPLKPVAVITGASSGIGAALARVFAAKGHDLVLVGRRQALLDALANEIAAGGRNRPLVIAIDLTRIDAPVRIGHELGARRLEPAFIVNNAGYGLVGRAAELDRTEQLAMIDLNVRALTDLSLRFIGSLARQRGGILNVASVSAFLPGPGMALYHATKSYVLSFSEALHTELAPLGVRVTVLCPGPVATEFQARAGLETTQLPRLLLRSAEWVALQGYEGLMRGKRVVIPGWSNKLLRLVLQAAPQGVILRSTDKAMKRRSMAQPRWPKRR
jgi:short-subunit dehydrogenase